MDAKAYIESGILELYVAGTLSEKENQEVYDMMMAHPEVLQEVLEIESSVIKLTASVAPSTNRNRIFKAVKDHLGFAKKPKVVSITKPKYNWITYTGWAAAFIFGGALLWLANENKQLQTDFQISETQQELLETQIENSKNSLEEANTFISILRDENIKQVPLEGQGDFASTFAKVYWDQKTNRIFLDAQGLPEPPAGTVYQVWSLTLSPLTPTSLGTIDDFISDENKIFEIKNPNESEAFGITLEPAGGSETPTMDQLYTLGVVNAS